MCLHLWCAHVYRAPHLEHMPLVDAVQPLGTSSVVKPGCRGIWKLRAFRQVYWLHMGLL